MAAPSTGTCGLMERSVRERVPPLLTDLYQFTMAYAYWRAGRHQEPAVFELFFRDNPFDGGFSLFAGLHDCLLFLRSFRITDRGESPTFHRIVTITVKGHAQAPAVFVDTDVEFLRFILPPNTDPAFFDFLRGLDCSTVTVRSVPEGSVVFARVRFWAETTAVRAEGISGANRILTPTEPTPTKTHPAICLPGFDLTSNVQAGFLFGIPVAGTMAHSYVTSFSSLEEVWPQLCPFSAFVSTQTLVTASGDPDPVDVVSLTKVWLRRVCDLLGAEPGKIHEGELAAFLSYAIAYPQNFLPVIDSYSVGWFSASTFNSLTIVGSNNISEETMTELNKKANEINVVEMGMLTGPCRVKICIMLFVFQAGGGGDNSAVSVTPAQVTCLRREVFLKGQVLFCPRHSLLGQVRPVQQPYRILFLRHVWWNP
ncbi:hypothetical protein GOODEAATRI_027186 [Goodea atripinnis]|uniref:nicotinate phosphoribosyltransferase n=1 Tax=Goodea atripinnis TaxID=208336 RepID=A0ABV0PHM1_9TELE